MLKMGTNLLDKVIERIRGRMMDQWYKHWSIRKKGMTAGRL